jgi:hypothetical protein
MFKQCPECGEEYQQWVERCRECDVALVLPGSEPIAREGEAEPAFEPPPEDAVIVKIGDPGDLHALAEALQEHGISSWIAAHTLPAEQAGGRSLGLAVRRADLDAARAIGEELVRSTLHDLEGVELPEYDASSCPACGTPTPENASACAECGLEFPEMDPNSGALVR